MGADPGAHYRASRRRLIELLRDRPPALWATPVPACPGWDVRATVSHLLGNIEDVQVGHLSGPPSRAQVAEQIARHAGGPADALLDEWAEAAASFDELVSRAGIWPVAMDAITHEHDVRGAIGEPGARDDETVRTIARLLVTGELPVTLVFELGDERLSTDDAGGPVHTVATNAFEVTRIRFGRRSRAQVREMAWDPPLPAVPDGLFVFGPRTTPLVE